MNIDNKIFEKDHLKIIVTDSGLGGLSVQGLLDKELRKRKIDCTVELIFFNSVVDHDYGYNQMKNHDEKVQVFNSALSAMLRFDPDLILIACNTLSVIYYSTEISKSINILVLGIVDSGIEFVLERIEEGSNIILFGTETTIASNQHKDKLLANNIKPTQITTQVCDYLESEIQIDPKSDRVKFSINKFADEAFRKIKEATETTFGVLCCTHYGYSREIFEETLNKKTMNAFILNPNDKMAVVAASGFATGKTEKPKIVNKIYSKVDITESEIKTLSDLLSNDSNKFSKVLKNYVWDKELFLF